MKPSKDVEQFLEKLKIKESCWPKLQTQGKLLDCIRGLSFIFIEYTCCICPFATAITDMETLQDLTQDDLKSIGLLLGDANKIVRGLKEEKRVID